MTSLSFRNSDNRVPPAYDGGAAVLCVGHWPVRLPDPRRRQSKPRPQPHRLRNKIAISRAAPRGVGPPEQVPPLHPAYYGRPWTQLRDEMVASGAKTVKELKPRRIAVFYGSAGQRHVARRTKRACNACRTCGPRTALQDHRLLQERPFSRPGPQPEAPRERARVIDVDGRGEHDAR
jgi:hypothetical protein